MLGPSLAIMLNIMLLKVQKLTVILVFSEEELKNEKVYKYITIMRPRSCVTTTRLYSLCGPARLKGEKTKYKNRKIDLQY